MFHASNDAHANIRTLIYIFLNQGAPIAADFGSSILKVDWSIQNTVTLVCISAD